MVWREKRFISYLRVSTDKQGERGLGIEAQRDAVLRHLNGGGWNHLAEYVGVESGKRSDRPKLLQALEHAKLSGATLIIAKLDRLSRDAHFLLGLQKAGVEFVAADMPEANRLTVGLMAVIAEHEREMISKRTREALAVVKVRIRRTGQRGRPDIKRLGHPNGAAHLKGKGNALALAGLCAKADASAARLAPVIAAIQAEGITSANGIAAALNGKSFLSPRGSKWDAKAVIRLQSRLARSTV